MAFRRSPSCKVNVRGYVSSLWFNFVITILRIHQIIADDVSVMAKDLHV